MNVWDWQRQADVDLDWLEDHCTRIYYFGLGFIQVKIDETYRIHFYSSELPTITEDIHDHRYNFESKILSGVLVNSRWQTVDGSDYSIYYESCNPAKSAPKLDQLCDLKLSRLDIFYPGESYQMSHEEFHRVTGKSCITLLKRGPIVKEFAKIVTPVGKTPVCAFSKTYPNEELWDMIGRML